MSVFKSEFTRALKTIPSANCNIPSPNVIVSSLTTDTAVNQLIDGAVDFITLNVQAGDVVYNTSANQAATVVGVIDANTLELNADVAPTGDNYTIYQASSQTGLGNTGCCLYFQEEDASIEVTTLGQENVLINKTTKGVLLLQVVALKDHSGTNHPIALW